MRNSVEPAVGLTGNDDDDDVFHLQTNTALKPRPDDDGKKLRCVARIPDTDLKSSDQLDVAVECK